MTNKRTLIIIIAAAIIFAGITVLTVLLPQLNNNVRFVYSDGALISETPFEKDKKIIPPKVEDKNGMIFIGWDKATDNITKPDTFKAIMKKPSQLDYIFNVENGENNILIYTVSIGSISQNITEVVFPNKTDEDKPITKICASSYGALNADITKIVIPYGIKVIDSGAFRGYNKVTDIFIPDSVTEIGSYAFDNCGINSLSLPAATQGIGFSLFGICDKKITLKISESNESFKIQNGNLLSRDGKVFYQFLDFTSNTCDIPNSVETIAEKSFFEQNIMAVKLPIGIKEIGSSAFYRCNSLITVTNSSTALRKIGDYAFYNCNGLTEFYLPDSLTYIGNSAFNSTSLIRIIIPRNVTYIGHNAFCDVSDLSIYCRGSKGIIKNDENDWAKNSPVLYDYKGNNEGKKYTVRFVFIDKNNNEQEIIAYEIEFGKKCPIPLLPEIIGYNFNCYKATLNGNNIDVNEFCNSVICDITIYACDSTSSDTDVA